MTDWYRRKSWTKIDEEEFYLKLGRARKDSRAQYLKIQAIELLETKDVKLLEVARQLLDKMLTDYPEDKFNRSSALHTLGEIAKANQDFDTAIDYYAQALAFEQVYPNMKTQAYLNYSELIVKTNKAELYDKIENLLKAEVSNLIFPLHKYKVFSLLAIIYQDKNENELAKEFALEAEKYANAETSGLRYHKHLGLVKERIDWLDELVNKNNR
jgi:tetratricopeptide (TPR) repeat protein